MELLDAVRFTPGSLAVPEPAQRVVANAAPHTVSDMPMDIVYINGFTAQTVIGIDESELHAPQAVRLDLAIGVPSIRACLTDQIDDTVNYAAVHHALRELMVSHGVQLLERLAEKIAQLLIADFGARWVRVSLAKPAKFDDVESVGVVIERGGR